MRTFAESGSLAESGNAAGNGIDFGQFRPPETNEAPLLAGIRDANERKIVHYGAMGLTAGGALLCAGGIATVCAGFSGGMDSETMHRGGLMIIAGSVTAALFSVVMNATGLTSPE